MWREAQPDLGDALRPTRARVLDITPGLSPASFAGPAEADRPFPLDRPEHRVVARARHGLYAALLAVGVHDGDEALVPAYHHGSEVEALRRAGLRCQAYDVDGALRPVEMSLEQLVGPRTKVLHLVHHLGVPQDARYWRAWCEARGLLLVEDGAQSWLASTADGGPAGSYGDIAIFCAHKTVGVPDGGIVISRVPLPSPPVPRGLGLAPTLRRVERWIRQRLPITATDPTAPSAESPDGFALGAIDRPAAGLTGPLLRRLARPHVAKLRRRHERELRELLMAHITPLFPVLPSGAVPLALPILVRDKPAVLAGLAAGGVHGGMLWSTAHPSVDVSGSPTAALLRRHLVGLPVHQELRPADLERIAQAVLACPRAALEAPRDLLRTRALAVAGR